MEYNAGGRTKKQDVLWRHMQDVSVELRQIKLTNRNVRCFIVQNGKSYTNIEELENEMSNLEV